MEVNSQLRASAALPPKKELQYPFQRKLMIPNTGVDVPGIKPRLSNLQLVATLSYAGSYFNV
jgi:hypothetical protein